ncbi:MAG: D-hexose-6-phosphate mutarotase [Verrucomicrobiota bacterium]
MNLPDCVTLENAASDYPVYVIRHPNVTGKVAVNGAHVMEWQPTSQAHPVLYLSPDAVLEKGKAIRGGIPICWPWFGGHPADATKPMHGIARILPWELVRVDASDSHVAMLFKLQSNEDSASHWPYDFTCHLGISLGEKLEVSLMTQNTGREAFVVTEALHTYLSVGDISQTIVRGLSGAKYVDTVGGQHTHCAGQEADITFDREVDRQYASTSGVVIEDPAWSRKLIVDKLGSGTTVVWNPWIEKSKRLADLPDEAFHGFLCVEAANANESPVRVPSGGQHVIVTTVSVA